MNETVRHERERRGLSVRAAAILGGVSNTTWARYEEDGKLTPRMRRAVAEAFQWPSDWPESPPPAEPTLGEKVDYLIARTEELVRMMSSMVTRWEIEDLPDGESAGGDPQ